jgi:thiamine transport system permease protein
VLALAAIPLVVLVVFFVYPVLGIVGQGFVSDGRFAPGAVLEVLGRPRTGRVLWFTLWSAGLATLVTLLAGLPLAFVLHRLSFPAAACCGRWWWCRSCCRPSWSGSRSASSSRRPAGWAGCTSRARRRRSSPPSSSSTSRSWCARSGRSGRAWTPDASRRPPRWGRAPCRSSGPSRCRPCCRRSWARRPVVFLFCSTAFGIVLTLGGLRYANVETEIWLLTTQELDLVGAAALSVLQLVVIVGLLVLTHVTRRTPDTSTVPPGPRAARAAATRGCSAGRPSCWPPWCSRCWPC